MIDNRPMAPDLGAPRPRSLPKPAADEAADPIYATPPASALPELPATSPATPVAPEARSPLVAEVSPPIQEPLAPSIPSVPVSLPPLPAADATAAGDAHAPVSAAAVPDTQTTVQRTPPPRLRRQEIFVQVSSRVTVETRDMLDDIGAREGSSMRHTLEKVIRSYYEQLP